MQKQFFISRIIVILFSALVILYLCLFEFKVLVGLENDIQKLENRSYIINPGEKICGKNKGENILIMSFNPSKTTNFNQRQAIRNTWTNKNFKENSLLKNVFIIGLSPDQTVNKRIQLESEIFGDIVQGNFIDTYRNLTFKTILGIKWMSEYCDNAKFILKIDDDMVVNTKSLSDYFFILTKNNTITLNNSMYGLCTATIPQRDKNSKWYIPAEDYAGNVYPKYCIGSAYIFTSDLMKPMYNLTHYIKPFIMEDVYVGMLAKELNTNFNQIWQYWCYNSYMAVNFTMNTKSECFHFVLVYNLESFYTVWNLITFKYLESTSTVCEVLIPNFYGNN